MLDVKQVPPDQYCTIGEKTVLEVYVKIGDYVVEGDDVVEVETPMVILGINASANGRVVQMYVTVGDRVEAGDQLFVIDTSAELPSSYLARWQNECACPICGTRITNRKQRGERDPCLQRYLYSESGDCGRCQLPLRRDKSDDGWEAWTVAAKPPEST